MRRGLTRKAYAADLTRVTLRAGTARLRGGVTLLRWTSCVVQGHSEARLQTPGKVHQLHTPEKVHQLHTPVGSDSEVEPI